MHSPPAVHFAVRRSRWYGMVLLVLWMLGACAMLAFLFFQTVSSLQIFVWLMVLLLGAGLALQGWRNTPSGLLHWDGAVWHWSGFAGDAPCTVLLHVDLQKLLIVSIRQNGRQPVGLWIESARGDRSWSALRRAVVGSLRAVQSPSRADEALTDQVGA